MLPLTLSFQVGSYQKRSKPHNLNDHFGINMAFSGPKKGPERRESKIVVMDPNSLKFMAARLKPDMDYKCLWAVLEREKPGVAAFSNVNSQNNNVGFSEINVLSYHLIRDQDLAVYIHKDLKLVVLNDISAGDSTWFKIEQDGSKSLVGVVRSGVRQQDINRGIVMGKQKIGDDANVLVTGEWNRYRLSDVESEFKELKISYFHGDDASCSFFAIKSKFYQGTVLKVYFLLFTKKIRFVFVAELSSMFL